LSELFKVGFLKQNVTNLTKLKKYNKIYERKKNTFSNSKTSRNISRKRKA
jgi:hypothetical protein